MLTGKEKAESLLSVYEENFYFTYIEDLTTLMNYEGIVGVAYQIHTPLWNDGDVCKKRVHFIAPLNSAVDEGYLLLSDSRLIITDIPEIDYEDCIPEEHAKLLKTAAIENKYGLSSLKHEYKIPRFETFLRTFAELILPTNEQGYILETGEWYRESYETDY